MKLTIGILIGILLVSLAPVNLAQAEETPTGTIIHVVAWGETLYKIAQKYGVSMADIIALNDLISPDRIYAGQQLVISQASRPTGETVIYTVQRGDTLGEIARDFGVPLADIIAANGILNPSHIYVGQRLSIPGASSERPADPGSTGRPMTHVVQPGETLSRIARQYGVSMWALAQANAIANPSLLYTGQVLRITEASPGAPAPSVTSGKQIVVVLSQQRTYAYEDGRLVREFIVSTGRAATPTVLGSYTIVRKLPSQRMTGPGYDLPGVPWVMYFYQGYSFHGTYWHNNFGTPMSHGCVNMRTPEAEWLYNWAPIGTSVVVLP
jgi:LysM repeat protein